MPLTFLTDLSPEATTNTQHGELGLFLVPQPHREVGSQFPAYPTQTSSLQPSRRLWRVFLKVGVRVLSDGYCSQVIPRAAQISQGMDCKLQPRCPTRAWSRIETVLQRTDCDVM